MDRVESSAWHLAAGSATIFVLAVVLSGASWTAAFVAVAVAVAGWSMRAPVIAGAALAVIAWVILTGFDVHAYGDLRVTGWGDLARFAVFAGAALAGAAGGRLGFRSYEEYDEASGLSTEVMPVEVPRQASRTPSVQGTARPA
jgi:hypothetical protein